MVRACVRNDFSQHSSQQSEMSHRSLRGHLGSGDLYWSVMVGTGQNWLSSSQKRQGDSRRTSPRC